MAGEYLWYKGYAIDRSTGKLSKDVRNIQVFVYDSIGSLIERSMVLANDGIFFNQIKLDSTYTPGRYYFKAMTNYMNNFKESDAYLHKFEVIDEVEKTNYNATDIKVNIRPEGQEIVYGLNANLGIKITNDIGKPEQSSLTLLEDNEPIRELKSSTSGLAKINFRPAKGKAYKIKATTLGGFEKLIPIENIKPKGTSLQLNDLKDYIYLTIETTFSDKKEDWQLVIFKNKQIVSVEIDMNDTIKSIALEKNKLFKGLNTIQLLRGGKAVLERLYLNKTNDKSEFEGDYEVKKVEKQDSLILSLDFKSNSKLMLSASILPKENITYRSQQSIIKTLRLKPYINHDDYKSFFDYNTPSNLNELDLLLLMSKSRYTINLKTSEPPTLQFERQNGFEQRLSLLDKIKKDDELIIGLESKFNKEFTRELDSSRVFYLRNRYPVIGEKLKYAITTKQNKFKGPKLSLKTNVVFAINDSLSRKEVDTLPFIKDNQISKDKLVTSYTNTNELDEVVIKASAQPEDEFNRRSIYERKEKITEKIIQQNYKLSVYLRTLGFQVNETFNDLEVCIRNERVIIVLDGARLSDGSILANVTLEQFESVTINKFGIGSRFNTPTVTLESRKTPLYQNKPKAIFTTMTVKKGYEPSKKYESLNYTIYDSEMFRKLGVISWFPNIVVSQNTQENNSVELKIVDTGLKDAMIYIEGISEDGQLHSYNFPIELKKD
jgi:hypothetical protein